MLKRCTIGLAWALFARVASAQGYEVVHAFSHSDGTPSGELVAMADGSFFGTTQVGGRFSSGSIFRLVPDGLGGYAIDEVYSFFGQDGATPSAGLLLDASGMLFGTTAAGGDFGKGTIFSFDPAGRLTRLYSFGGPDGSQPKGKLVVGEDGFLYGNTFSGGDTDAGTVFRCDRAGNVTTLHSFVAASDGADPSAGLARGPAGSGMLYGTASFAGPNGVGTIFQIDSGGNFEVLHVINGGDDGLFPSAPLVLASDGNLYGTCNSGGASPGGTAFRVTPAGAYTVVASFGTYGESSPVGALLEAAPGIFVGTTAYGNSSAGVVFQMTASGDITTLYSFGAPPGDGNTPSGGLAFGADGLLYGVTGGGGERSIGTAYRVDLEGNYAQLDAFGRGDEGGSCIGGLLAATDGSLYGATKYYGDHTWGTIFRIHPDDTYEVVHAILPGEGGVVEGGLAEGQDGSVYAAARLNGLYGAGTVFKVDPVSGEGTVVHNFDVTDGGDPRAGLLATSAGDLWGVTSSGGAGGFGTIFRLDSNDVFTKVWDFTGAEGATPLAPLVQGSDQLFYGAASGGGAGGGTVFRLDPATGATALRSLQPADGQSPASSLLESSSPGLFYGTTQIGGSNGKGTLYQIDTTGALTVLHDFGSGSDAAAPQGGLQPAGTGGVYGTSRSGGLYGVGTVYFSDTAGHVTLMHEFNGYEGAHPQAGLTPGADGNLYGTATDQGRNDLGAVFRVIPGGPVTPIVTAIAPTSGPAAGGRSVMVTGAHFDPFAVTGIGPVLFSPFSIDTHEFVTVSPPLSAGSLNDVTVETVGLPTATLPEAFFADFLDVDSMNLFHDAVESIVRAGITAGCGGGYFCVDATVTRAQMAVFLLKGEHGSDYAPPACQGVFADVPCPGGFAVDWIEQIHAEGITAGCGGGNYCPGSSVTRAQMAVLLLKTLLGTSYVPPVVPPIFNDVPAGSFAADWINDLHTRGITGGCSASPPLYCPNAPNTRGQMAVFLTKTFGLP